MYVASSLCVFMDPWIQRPLARQMNPGVLEVLTPAFRDPQPAADLYGTIKSATLVDSDRSRFRDPLHRCPCRSFQHFYPPN